MRNVGKASSLPGHITKGSVFDDLNLTPAEALEAKVKADLWRALVEYIQTLGLAQKELAKRLGVHQPEVSNLLNGKLSKFSIGTLIQFGGRLDLGFHGGFTKPKVQKGTVKTMHARATESSTRGHLAGVA